MQRIINESKTIEVSKERLGLGVDVVEIARFRKICSRTPSFKKKLFSKEELSYCEGKADPLPHLAVRFAAKEAVLKALKIGFSNGVDYRDVEVITSKNSVPKVDLHNTAKEIASEKGVVEIPISLSHTDKDAVCCAIAITQRSLDEKTRSKNTVDELTRQFKSLRANLDEI